MSFISSFGRFPRVILLVFIISLCLPAYVYDAHEAAASIESICAHSLNPQISPEHCREKLQSSHQTRMDWGFPILISGFLGLFLGIYAWFSNILFLIGYQLMKRKKYTAGLIFAVGAFLLGLQSFMLNSWPLDEGGVMEATIKYFTVGYYLWLASFLLLAWYAYKQSKQSNISLNSSSSSARPR